MKKTKKKAYFMPKIARKIACQYSGAWIVGGAAMPNTTECKDFDIAVSWSDWQQVAFLIPKNAKPTLFGGWKITEGKWTIDVWPAEIIDIFTCAKCEYMWQPKLNIRIHREDTEDVKSMRAY